MTAQERVEIAVVGAGIAGVATAYYLTTEFNKHSVLLIDPRQPMSYTSAQSGDNYRNWWPHPTMAAFTNHSIDELDRLAVDSNDFFHMTRGGYALATRQRDAGVYADAVLGDIDVDVISGSDIAARFPALSADIRNVIHIRRGGDISGQQLGQYMLEKIRAVGGKRMQGQVTSVEPGYVLGVARTDETRAVRADIVVNAAGPFVKEVAAMVGYQLPVTNVYQQKIAFEDDAGVIPRDMPFSIDLDEKVLVWSDEERELLAEDDELAWLTQPIHGGTHCRPEGGAGGKWVKLGWACNHRPCEPQEDLANEPAIDPRFPEIVIRGAAAFLPALQHYIENPPLRFTHYGGYYTMTEENWPLIGPAGEPGSFVVGALSGFGSMSACAAGRLCAAHVCHGQLPRYAADLSLARYDNPVLMDQLSAADKGLL